VQGASLSPGRAIGHLCVAGHGVARLSQQHSSQQPSREVERFRRHVTHLIEDLQQTVTVMDTKSMSAEAGILRAHMALLQDPEFHQQVHRSIHEAQHAAEEAVERVLDQMAELMASSADSFLAGRAADFHDLAQQLKGRLAGVDRDLHACVGDVDDAIVVLDELLPSVVLKARELGVRGLVVSQGTDMSHGAILAKSFGIPVLRAADLELLRSFQHRCVLLDADGGRLVLDPQDVEIAVEPVAPAPVAKTLPAKLWLSIVDGSQLGGIDWTGIEGVGLYRTEVLFMQHLDEFPGEEEQVRAYRQVFEAAGNRPVVIRTADLGADKRVAGMSFGPEQNPYLGLRAHRIFRFHPEIAVTQLRAILRAAAGDHQLRLMFPMLETLDQWRFMQQLVSQAQGSLRTEGLEYQEDYRQGVLIETPSAVWSFDEFLDVVDFASVGTNDLVQYFFAVDRDTANVADFYQPEHPVMLQVLQSLAARARQFGKPLSICGEIAADPQLVLLLIGLGIEDISVNPSQVPVLRRHLAGLTQDDCRTLAEACLRAKTVDEVRRQLRRSSAPFDKPMPVGQAIDPVCGMVVRIEDARFTLEREGRRYYFCCAPCMRQFCRADWTI
jgi:phosphoenolpyruvate-protein kinase (PTS system EI component)/YHS domain-containing protein